MTKGQVAYVFQAALLCEACAQVVCADCGVQPDRDSDQYPQGPYANGGGEADTPQHCDHCREFLGNPLTPEGVEYVRLRIAQKITVTTQEWADFYGLSREIEERP